MILRRRLTFFKPVKLNDQVEKKFFVIDFSIGRITSFRKKVDFINLKTLSDWLYAEKHKDV